MKVDELNACYMLKLYADDFKESPQINLEDFEDYLFLYFTKPNFTIIAKKYNRKLWNYSIRMGQRIIQFKDEY